MVSTDLVLVRLDKARCYLAEAKTLQNVGKVIAIAEAALVYAKRVNASQETKDEVAEFLIRAEMKLGELLKTTPMQAGARGKAGPGKGKRGAKVEPRLDAPPTLAALGIDKKTSARAKMLASAPNEVEKILANRNGKELNPNKVAMELREKSQKTARESKKQAAAKSLKKLDSRILVGDFREHADKIPDGSLSLIFTDPPYDRKSESLFSDLGQFAVDKLADGGSLVSYVGHVQLISALTALNEKLRYWWIMCCDHANSKALMNQYGIRVCWKPMLWFVRGTRSDKKQVVFDKVSGGQEKEHHAWQQSVSEAEYFIDNLCPADGIVCDPFLGGGTTAIAAIRLKRQWIGIEIDREQVCLVTQRIGEID